jgi:hypothetical protein
MRGEGRTERENESRKSSGTDKKERTTHEQIAANEKRCHPFF